MKQTLETKKHKDTCMASLSCMLPGCDGSKQSCNVDCFLASG